MPCSMLNVAVSTDVYVTGSVPSTGLNGIRGGFILVALLKLALSDLGAIRMRTVRASRKAVAEHAAWHLARRG